MEKHSNQSLIMNNLTVSIEPTNNCIPDDFQWLLKDGDKIIGRSSMINTLEFILDEVAMMKKRFNNGRVDVVIQSGVDVKLPDTGECWHDFVHQMREEFSCKARYDSAFEDCLNYMTEHLKISGLELDTELRLRS